MADEAPIELEKVSKSFGSLVVLDEVSLAIPRGATTAIIVNAIINPYITDPR